MKRILILSLAVVFAFAQHAPVLAQTTGVIEGIATGPGGALPNSSIQVLNSQGQVVGKAVTNVTGNFRIGNLPPGTYTVQTLGTNGGVISTATANLTTTAMTATVTMSATAAAIAGAAGAAAGAAGAAAGAAAGGAAAAAGGAAAGAAGAAAGAAAAGAAAAGAAVAGVSTAAVIGGVAAAAAVAGTVAVTQTNANASPSR